MTLEPWIEKQRDKYVVRWRDAAGKVQSDKGYRYSSRSDAKPRRDVIRGLLKNKSYGLVDESRSILECSTAFKESQRGQVSDGRIDNGYQTSLNLFMSVCAKMSPSVTLMGQLRRKVILDYKTELYHRKMSEHSIRLYLAAISVWLKWAKDNEWILENPFVDIGLPVPKSVDRFLTDAQLLALERVIDDEEFRCIFRIGYQVGLRPGEIINIRPDHLTWHLDKKIWTLAIPPDNNKTSTGRMVVVSAGLVKLIPKDYEVQPFERWTPRRMSAHFARALLAADIKDKVLRNGRTVQIIFYWTRHTYARLQLEKGMDLGILMVLMGHSSIKMTKDTYGHLERSFVIDRASAFSQIAARFDTALLSVADCRANAGQAGQIEDTSGNSMTLVATVNNEAL